MNIIRSWFPAFIPVLILLFCVSCDKSIYNNLFTEMYTVTYDGNGNTGGTVPVDTNFYYNGYQAYVSANTGVLVRTGYTFICWNTSDDGSGTDYMPGDILIISGSSITLYAKWRTVSRIIFTSNRDGNNEIYIMDADGKNQINLSNNPANDDCPAWSPDGTKIVFVTDRDGNNEIYTMDADGSGQTNISNNSANDSNPSWSPDGTKIAFQTNRDGNDEIYTMNATDGSGLSNLTNDSGPDMEPFWSPDGTQIAYVTYRGALYRDIWVMNSDGSGQVNRSNYGDTEFNPAWSPNNLKIAHVRMTLYNYEIYVMNASDGSAKTNLTNTGSGISTDPGEFKPSWSPDSLFIVFFTNRDGNNQIYTMNASDGSSQTNISNNSASNTNPSWSPF